MTKRGLPPLKDTHNSKEEDEQQQQQSKPLYQINRSLIRMLTILAEAGDEGLYTKELLERMGSVSYGQKMVKLGEKKGCIKRVRNIKPTGKGNYRVVNHITPKGKQLVKRWTQAANDNNN